MTRAEAAIKWDNLLTRLDVRYVGKIYAALKEQYRAFGEDIKTVGIDQARARLTYDWLNRGVGQVIQKLHTEAGVALARQTLAGLRKEKIKLKRQGLGFNEEWARDIQNYFRLHLLEKSVLPISTTTRERLLEILNKGIEEGWSIDEIVAKVNDLDEIRNRARKIVRTETVRAANYGVLLGSDKYDYETEKEWLAINDNRTRRTHRHGTGVDGQKIDLENRFSNGLLFPGDPDGGPQETINCRCRIVITAKRDANGRIIPKKSPTRVSRNGSLIDALSGIAAGISLGNMLSSIED